MAPKRDNAVKLTKSPFKKNPSQLNGTKNDETLAYERKSLREHIYHRPDSYIGSTESQTVPSWLYDISTEENDTASETGETTEKDKGPKFVYRNATYVPGLLKLVDELLVNAADNKTNDASMDKIKVAIDIADGSISVWNNGAGIPVLIHTIEQIYVPELIFGNLLTSTNYNDDQQKTTGGRNGYGAKLANIFSNEFTVECGDSTRHLRYSQTWRNSMFERDNPKISSYANKTDFTMVTFKPRLERFGLNSLDADFCALIRRRAHDLAGTTEGIKVEFTLKNGNEVMVEETIKYKSFRDYCGMYTHVSDIIADESDRWDVCIAPSITDTMMQVSFVNSIYTRAGNHVEHVLAQIVPEILTKLGGDKGALNANQIKSQMFVFVRSVIVNPTFDGQTKEVMTLRVANFGSRYTPSQTFMKKLLSPSTALMTRIRELNESKKFDALKKTDGAKVARLIIDKLDDANHAGKRDSLKCSLILTEGDSAKALAVAGLSIVGRDYYGVYPLRGKVLNVRDAAVKQILDNEEISDLKKILGLKPGVKRSQLRYGRVIPMVDADEDGIHIKSLLLNYFEKFHPELLEEEDFFNTFVTPLVRFQNKKRKNEYKYFYNMSDARHFAATNRGWDQKYLKGLGSSTTVDAKIYFSNIAKNIKSYKPITREERELVDMIFNKKRASERRDWLDTFIPNNEIDITKSSYTISELLNKEQILFSMADNFRSIPSVIDGLKPSQRKVLFTLLTEYAKAPGKYTESPAKKTAVIAGEVVTAAAYHHGETSLTHTITSMAQNFVGSNNINLLYPEGQFGTRLDGGKDAASPRYTFTKLNTITTTIFCIDDNPLLKYLEDDGIEIEPEFYVPILPMLLVNGADGIGTGWRSFFPTYNPLDLVASIRLMLSGQTPPPLSPWFLGFTGDVVQTSSVQWTTHGKWSFNANRLIITELPIGMWTNKFKTILEEMTLDGAVKEFRENHTDTRVYFEIMVGNKSDAEKIVNKLSTTFTLKNLVAFNTSGKIIRYNDVSEIMREHFFARLKLYVDRRVALLANLESSLTILENKVRFIDLVINNHIQIINRPKREILAELEGLGFSEISELLKMSIFSLSKDDIDSLIESRNSLANKKTILENKSPGDLWNDDLIIFEQAYSEFIKEIGDAVSRDYSKVKM
jgi:DNA topoisomerase-2